MSKINKLLIIIIYNTTFSFYIFYGSTLSKSQKLIYFLYTFIYSFLILFGNRIEMNKIDYKSESIRTRFFLACIIDFLVFMFLLFIALVGVYAYPSKLLTFAAVHLIFGYFIISNIWIPSLGFYITRIRVIDTINDSSVKSLYKKIVVNILSIFGIIGFFSFTEMFWSNQYFDYIFIMLLFLLAIDIIFFLYSKSRNRLFLKLFKMEIIKLE